MHRKALEALSAVRPPMSRLDRSREPAKLSADIVEAWRGTEVAIRALLGGSMLSGSALIHDARQRHLLTFEQANALAGFAAAAGRCSDAGYAPSDNDLNEVREGFDEFESSLSMVESALKMTPGEAMSTKGLRASPLGTPRPVPLPPEPQPWWFMAVVGVAVIAVLGAGSYFGYRLLGTRSNATMVNAAAELYGQGKLEEARDAFEDVIRKEPTNSLAHTYLARIARETGDLKLAREQATLAIEADPKNVNALREMAGALLASRDYEMARRFYVRVVEAAPDDLTAQGYLGCTLYKLGRPDQGKNWIDRAGAGPWSVCAGPAGAPTKQTP
jgi:tetratricopeptide (TPR) repeat protein